jgi:type II secretion system protein G
MMEPKGPRRGFTLIELLIVVAIIAILALIAVPNFLEAQTRAKVSRCLADMRSLATALESYHVDNAAYPYSMEGDWPPDLPRYSPYRGLTHLSTPIAYITSIPQDPFMAGSPSRLDNTWTHGGFHYWLREVRMKWADFEGWGPDAWIWIVGPENASKEWALLSYGPDRNLNWELKPDERQNTQYDPTNGTVSFGDIFRVGP